MQQTYDYLSSIGVRSHREVKRVHYETFHEWFKLHVSGHVTVNL